MSITLVSTGQQRFSLIHSQFYPPMTQNALPSQLYLLVPWDLPVEQQLNEVEQTKLSRALKQLLYALAQSSNQQALAIVNRELVNFSFDRILPAQPSATKTPLKPWEVKDFNHYFQVSHVQTQDSASCVVYSLFTAYQMMLGLGCSDHPFDSDQIALLKEGLKSYVYLLARVLKLDLENMEEME